MPVPHPATMADADVAPSETLRPHTSHGTAWTRLSGQWNRNAILSLVKSSETLGAGELEPSSRLGLKHASSKLANTDPRAEIIDFMAVREQWDAKRARLRRANEEVEAMASLQAGSTTEKSDSKLLITPSALRVANANGISIASLAGSGTNGRIELLDVEAALNAAALAAAADATRGRDGRQPPQPAALTGATATTAAIAAAVPLTAAEASMVVPMQVKAAVATAAAADPQIAKQHAEALRESAEQLEAIDARRISLSVGTPGRTEGSGTRTRAASVEEAGDAADQAAAEVLDAENAMRQVAVTAPLPSGLLAASTEAALQASEAIARAAKSAAASADVERAEGVAAAWRAAMRASQEADAAEVLRDRMATAVAEVVGVHGQAAPSAATARAVYEWVTRAAQLASDAVKAWDQTASALEAATHTPLSSSSPS